MVRTVKDPETRRAEIISAARHLFGTREYEKTTMQDVIEELGIAKGTIYYYFKSKEELLDAVINQMGDEMVEHMQFALDNGKGNAIEMFQQLIAAGNIADENAEIMEQLHNPRNAGMHAAMMAVAIKRSAPLYAKVVEQGCSEGIFHVAAPLETSEFILTSIQYLLDTGVYQWTGEDLMRRAIAFPGMIETLLGAQPGSFQFLLQMGQ
jgi:AcrR family transcriptional regulator